MARATACKQQPSLTRKRLKVREMQERSSNHGEAKGFVVGLLPSYSHLWDQRIRNEALKKDKKRVDESKGNHNWHMGPLHLLDLPGLISTNL